jgi:hypothetical protein
MKSFIAILQLIMLIGFNFSLCFRTHHVYFFLFLYSHYINFRKIDHFFSLLFSYMRNIKFFFSSFSFIHSCNNLFLLFNFIFSNITSIFYVYIEYKLAGYLLTFFSSLVHKCIHTRTYKIIFII